MPKAKWARVPFRPAPYNQVVRQSECLPIGILLPRDRDTVVRLNAKARSPHRKSYTLVVLLDHMRAGGKGLAMSGVLQLNTVYPGHSTGKIVEQLHRSLQARGWDSSVAYGRGAKVEEPGVFKTSNDLEAKLNALSVRITGIPYGGMPFSTQRVFRLIERLRPTVVHMHCINGHFGNIYRILDYLKAKHVPTVITLHAEFMYTGGCGHSFECERWREKPGCGQCPQLRQATNSWFLDRTADNWLLMKRAFADWDASRIVIASVSPWLRDRAASAPVMSHLPHEIVLNGIDTDIFSPAPQLDTVAIRSQYAEPKIILHVTSNFSLLQNSTKGGRYVVELARLLGPEYRVLIAGTTDESHEDLPPNMTLLGRVADQAELARLYSAAEVTVLTSRRETFSMVCPESLACGTPVVGFKAGAPEMIAIKEYSEFFEQGDVAGMASAVRKWVGAAPELRANIAGEAKSVYWSGQMVDDYVRLYERVIDG